jgi:antitoxin component YwqK of YwqJK toxin-antitoxin module
MGGIKIINLILIISLMFFSSSCSDNNIKEKISYYKNGDIREILYNKTDKMHGLKTQFYPNGNLNTISYFKNVKSTIFIGFYESGQILMKGNIENDLYEGLWVYYYGTGKLMNKGNFKKGIRVGIWHHYSKEGKLTIEDCKEGVKD